MRSMHLCYITLSLCGSFLGTLISLHHYFDPMCHLQICPSSGLPCDCGAAASVKPGAVITTDSGDKLKYGGSAVPGKPSCEPIFPSELRSRVAQPLELPGKLATWYR